MEDHQLFCETMEGSDADESENRNRNRNKSKQSKIAHALDDSCATLLRRLDVGGDQCVRVDVPGDTT